MDDLTAGETPEEAEQLTIGDMKQAAEAYRALAKQSMRLFLEFEELTRQAAQLCTDFADAFEALDTKGNDDAGI